MTVLREPNARDILGEASERHPRGIREAGETGGQQEAHAVERGAVVKSLEEDYVVTGGFSLTLTLA